MHLKTGSLLGSRLHAPRAGLARAICMWLDAVHVNDQFELFMRSVMVMVMVARAGAGAGAAGAAASE